MTYQTIDNNGISIAYYKTEATTPDLPGVIFCGGFMSDMSGTKATYLEEQCQTRGQAYVRFDYSGHGVSGGKFTDGNIGTWLSDALAIFDHLTSGPQIVVGSSMGGWISLLLSQERAESLQGWIGLAPAPDFTQDIFKNGFTDEQRKTLETEGIVYQPTPYGDPYPLTQQLFDDGKNHLMLQDKIQMNCPARIIHSKLDDAVPWQKSETIRKKLTTTDIQISYLNDGDHSLSRPQDLALLNKYIEEINAL